VGGALVDWLGWRSVFFLNLPIVLAAGAVAVRVVPESRRAPERRLDLPGTVLGALLLGVVTFGFIEAGRTGLNGAALLAAGAGTALLVGFIAVERSRDDPCCPSRSSVARPSASPTRPPGR
jgi:MFS family permease